MGRMRAIVIGAGIGAGLMYLFDPNNGYRRRRRLRAQAERVSDATQSVLQTAGGARKRARGIVGAIRARLRPAPIGDAVLTERVRAAIARVAAHPGSIDVSVDNGRVRLSGPAFAGEIPLIVDRVYDVRGVRDVDNRLLPQTEAQFDTARTRAGESTPPRRGSARWSPAVRVGAGLGGAAAALYGFARGGLMPRALAWTGVALAARASTNLDLRRMTGIGPGRRAVDVQKSVRINAPIERVFETWANAASYPSFMTHVRSVRRIEDGMRAKRWRWTVAGPAGSEFEFDTTITAYDPNRVIAWRTEPGALVQHQGVVRLTEEANATTRADVRLSYNPVAGAVGHVIGKLFGADAKRQIDDDLARMKAYIETGTRPADAAAFQPTRAH